MVVARRTTTVLAVSLIAVLSCSVQALAGTPARRPAAGTSSSLPSLAVAVHEATDLGPLPSGVRVGLTFALRERDPSGLQALLDRGGRLTPAQFASTYGPAPTLVASVRGVLAREGLSSQWEPGETLMSVTGSAAAVEHALALQIHRFVLRGSTRFYAPLTTPEPPKALSKEVVAVTGADDYPSQLTAASSSKDGLTPSQIASFYDLTPLRSAGLDGSGMTVMFPEFAVPGTSVLSAYASKFGLPPFDVTVHTNPSWGQPAASTSEASSEAALDLEIVHGLAPGAKEVVYELGDATDLPQVVQAMVAANRGAVLSSSVGVNACEATSGARQYSLEISSAFAQAAAEGTSIFWASGDRGAFSCLPTGDASTEQEVSVGVEADSPDVTAVGGTTVFLGSNGAYFKEASWGEPLETWGSGGGISTIFQQPSWQVAPGLAAGSLGGRGVPDVAANADIVSGWDTFSPGQNGTEEGPVGGTSAATPCWAAITALIDEDLAQLGLAAVGFANPTLYYFSHDPSGLPAVPFHQVSEGSNLHFLATAGWSPATGLGSPDAAHLADDFEWYDRNTR
ncbi:MAG TPA: S53 family peptidase [Acidimicrobiales bacterium]|nr:S53 family peptidase [Acidimicrobiales bacterium]